MILNKAKATIYLNATHPKKNNECAVYIRITHDSKRKYYPVSICLTKNDFEKALTEKPGKKLVDVAKQLQAAKLEAQRVIDKMAFFTFELFEKKYITDRPVGDSLEKYFDATIEKLKKNDQIGTATSYNCAKSSLLNFRPGLKLIDINVSFLHQYEQWMNENKKSSTTISIYLRHLRTILNEAIDQDLIPKEIYPFGKKKYQVPESNNIKKAVTLEEITKILNYPTTPKSTTERAKAYWIFSFLCNGINIKDMALLKYENIKGNTISFKRAKTIRTKRNVQLIEVVIRDKMADIIKNFGNKDKHLDNFIFPILTKGLTATRQRQLIQQITHVVNDHMKAIGKDLGIDTTLTSYVARHTMATVALRSGSSVKFISESLGHSDIKVTQNYLKSFDMKAKTDLADLLNSI